MINLTNIKKKIIKHPFFKNINNLLIIFILSLIIIFYFIMKNIVPIKENFYELTAADIEKFKKELEDTKKKYSELETTSDEIKKKLENDIKELTISIDKLESLNAKSTQDINMLRDEKKMLTNECNSRIKNLESKIKQLKKIKTQSNNIETFKNKYKDNFQNTEGGSTEDGSTEDNSNDTNTTTTARPTRQPLPSKINETILNISRIRELRNKLKEHDTRQNETLQNLQERFNKYNTSN